MGRAYLDTNVHYIGRVAEQPTNSQILLDAASEGAFTVVLSDFLMDELHALFKKEQGKDAAGLASAAALMLPDTIFILEKQWKRHVEDLEPLVDDPDDLPHLCACIEAASDVFVTTNRRLAQMRVGERVPFRTPAEFVATELGLEALETPRGI